MPESADLTVDDNYGMIQDGFPPDEQVEATVKKMIGQLADIKGKALRGEL